MLAYLLEQAVIQGTEAKAMMTARSGILTVASNYLRDTPEIDWDDDGDDVVEASSLEFVKKEPPPKPKPPKSKEEREGEDLCLWSNFLASSHIVPFPRD
jgi:hypothetical protein